MFVKHGLHQKSHISGHLLRRPPLRNYSFYLKWEMGLDIQRVITITLQNLFQLYVL